MFRRVLLPVILGILAYGFWLSPDFKTLSAGVAIFLFGMLALEDGFRAFTGGVLERILKRSTDKTWKSIGFGVAATTIMQSSSLVSVITISFLSAGLLGLAAGIGIVFGANLGTTTGAWLVAGFGLKVKISAYAMPMLVFGVLLVFQKSKALKGIGYILTGLGFLFLGIHYIKEGFDAFGSSIDLTAWQLPGLGGILLFTLIGMLATVVMQSSHATMVLIITALATGQITYESSLALAIGANVGTTITAIIGSLSANAQGKRLAGAHLVFNVTTGLVALMFLTPLVQLVDIASQWLGIAAGDFTLKLAVFHTIFNLAGLLLMTPFIPYLVQRLESMFVEKEPKGFGPRYLHEASIDFPETAVEAVRKEVSALYDRAIDLILSGLGVSHRLARSDEPLLVLKKKKQRLAYFDIDLGYTQSIKNVYGAIVAFISKAAFTWELTQSGELHWLRSACYNIAESVKDTKHMQKNMLVFAVADNDAIRDAYNDIRIGLVELIRDIERVRREEDPDLAILALDDLFLAIEDRMQAMNHRIADMLQRHDISKEMATSLMNDSGYAYSIAQDLLEAVRSLLSISDPSGKRVQHELSLTEDELADVQGFEDDADEVGR